MKRLDLVTGSIWMITLLMAPVSAQPPVAAVRDVVDEHFGIIVHDPYRYMENMADPEVQDWFKAQADYSHGVLSTINGRDALYARLKELDEGKAYRIFSIRRQKDGSLFYKKIVAGENLPKLYYRDKHGVEKLLVDPEALESTNDQHFSLETYKPSPDGKYLVYGIAEGGSEETTLYLMNVETGASLPDVIDRIETAYNSPNWSPDGSGFYYARRQVIEPGMTQTDVYKNSKTFFHKLGDDIENDRITLSRNSSKDVDMLDVDFPSIYIPADSRYAVGKIKHGDSNEITLYSTQIKNLGKERVSWKQVCNVQDEVVDYTVKGDIIYLLTAHNAPRFKVVKTRLG